MYLKYIIATNEVIRILKSSKSALISIRVTVTELQVLSMAGRDTAKVTSREVLTTVVRVQSRN
jgi:hypothetical protein